MFFSAFKTAAQPFNVVKPTTGYKGALTLRPRTVRPPVQFIFSLGGPIDPQRAV
jgi:hypothetical protein